MLIDAIGNSIKIFSVFSILSIFAAPTCVKCMKSLATTRRQEDPHFSTIYVTQIVKQYIITCSRLLALVKIDFQISTLCNLAHKKTEFSKPCHDFLLSKLDVELCLHVSDQYFDM